MNYIKQYWKQGLLGAVFLGAVILGLTAYGLNQGTGDVVESEEISNGTATLMISSANEIRTNSEIPYEEGNQDNNNGPSEAEEEEGERDGWIEAFGKLNVRESASSESTVVGHFAYGEQVLVSGKAENGFYLVTGADSRSGKEITGYASEEYVLFEEPADPYVYLDVPLYRQYDVRWNGVRLGNSKFTIGSAGCTTTCLAMAKSYLSKETVRPDTMCASLWYDNNGNLGWPDECETRGGSNRYEFLFSKLKEGVPVLVGGKTRSGRQHWVLVVGYTGDAKEFKASDFMINDPGKDNRVNLKQFFDDFPILYKMAYYMG